MTDTFRVKVRFKELRPGWQSRLLERLLRDARPLPRPSGEFWRKSIAEPPRVAGLPSYWDKDGVWS